MIKTNIKKIAVTGCIGSGKSTVCRIIQELGYPVYYSDVKSTILANTNKSLKREIKLEFGEESYIDNKYNREYIASIVFSDKDKLEKLNSIFGKYVDEDFLKFCNVRKEYFEDDIVFYESALIYEHGKENNFDQVLCVYAKEEIIYNRLRERNGFTDEQIKNRLDSQLPSSIKIDKTPWIIDTSNGIVEKDIETWINFLQKIC